MEHNRTSRSGLRLLAAALCMGICLVLSVGITWARYQDRKTPDVTFLVEGTETVILTLGEPAAAQLVPSEEQTSDTEAETQMPAEEASPLVHVELPVTLANGTEKEFSKTNLSANLTVVAGLELGIPERVQMTLTIPDPVWVQQHPEALTETTPEGTTATEETVPTEPIPVITYYGIPEPIPEGSAMYRSHGPGWVYRFYLDPEGTRELEITLTGAVFSQWSATLHIQADAGAVSMLTVWADQIQE